MLGRQSDEISWVARGQRVSYLGSAGGKTHGNLELLT